MVRQTKHWYKDYKDYWSGIILLNLAEALILYFTRESNYSPVVDLLITFGLAIGVNAFISFLLFLIIGLFKRSFLLERYIKTFAAWSLIYLIVILIDAFLL